MPGGSGHIGWSLKKYFEPKGWKFKILTRTPRVLGNVLWDGETVADWRSELDWADILINLAGRSVNCRYDRAHLDEMRDSRVNSTRVLGEAMTACLNPPKLWLQSSTATIYSHRFDAPNDEATGVLGYDGSEGTASGADGDPKWIASIKIAKAWEAEFDKFVLRSTRKIAMRSSMVMSSAEGSVLDVFASLARNGLGGAAGDGKQFVSWIHETDFARAIEFLVEHDELSGPVNICSPIPLPNSDFLRELREQVGAKVALPTAKWMLEVGAYFMKTETELLLKSRRVVPRRLMEAGFAFEFPYWSEACADLMRQINARRN